jgi:hypothetical protein
MLKLAGLFLLLAGVLALLLDLRSHGLLWRAGRNYRRRRAERRIDEELRMLTVSSI